MRTLPSARIDSGLRGSCSELLGAARNCSELLGAEGKGARAVRRCSEVLGAAQSCSEKLETTRS